MTNPQLRILVIEDEPPIRKLLRMGLISQGYQIIEAHGRDAPRSTSSVARQRWIS